MNRRNFIKAASCGALLTGALPSVSHAAAENRPPIPGSLGDVVRLDLVRRLPGLRHQVSGYQLP
ncbi:twin-arginine translocation signal domain-containing protein [Escherichia coli]|nr:twin-arginine translocation signal domain-containing protein [Escherichia coli]